MGGDEGERVERVEPAGGGQENRDDDGGDRVPPAGLRDGADQTGVTAPAAAGGASSGGCSLRLLAGS